MWYCQKAKSAFGSIKIEHNILLHQLQYVFLIQTCVPLRDYFKIVHEVIWLQIRRTSTWKSVSEDGFNVSVWQTAVHPGFGNAHEWTVKSSGPKSGRQTRNGCGQAIKAVCTHRGLSPATTGKIPLTLRLNIQHSGQVICCRTEKIIWEQYSQFISYQTNIFDTYSISMCNLIKCAVYLSLSNLEIFL